MKITSKFKTYRTVDYTFQIGDDQRSAGGVHHHQIRRKANGVVVHRIVQSNGQYSNASKPSVALDEQIKMAEAAKE